MKTLFELLRCHATPGDEDEVAQYLLSAWQSAGWRTSSHGRYAISASREDDRDDVPTVLVCAHMDSPGYSVEQIDGDDVVLVRLGGARIGEHPVAGVLNVNGRHRHVALHPVDEDPDRCRTVAVPGVRHGDRACFRAEPKRVGKRLVESPFLDNRAGCWALVSLAQTLAEELPVRVVLGATSCEEIGGFGAPVLASAIKPDAVLCLDATYEDEAQDVRLGEGPVLTLSDASVIVGCTLRDRFRDFCAGHSLPIQTEVYNYSGTDSKAFPHQGLPAPVYALLLPTRGNHTPTETAHVADLETWIQLLQALLAADSDHGLWDVGFTS
jgi:putative aminopeptidase FrvX